jgi:hypothetical protein
MFGHDNHHEENKLPEPDSTLTHGTNDVTAPQTDDSAGYMDDVSPTTVTPTAAPADDDTAAAPIVDDAAAMPATDNDTSSVAVPAAEPAPIVAVPADTDRLLDIKQQALQQLTPLVGHLEQSPEEKFRTTMMMIQASDNHELVASAYEAAQQIPDEKVRAQALLDIVNEINYFTHGSTEA